MKKHVTLVQFGRNVRRLRLAAGLALEDVALHCAKSRDQIAHIEAGSVNPTLAVIDALARALGVEVAALLQDLPYAPAGPG